MRIKTDNDKCPFCNAILPVVILTDKPDKSFDDFDESEMINYEKGIWYENKFIKAEVEEFNQLRCPVPKCNDDSNYNTMANLKKHLKEVHKRFYCDTCLEHRTLLFKEQRLFTAPQLERHLYNGDIDDEKNVVFFHPFCKFCDLLCYDEDQLIKHLREKHYKCDICDVDKKWTFYKGYDNLEKHYNMSHYLCQEELCRKSHVVFKTGPELEHHMIKAHYDKSEAGKKNKIYGQ